MAIVAFLLHVTIIGLSVTSLVTNHWIEVNVIRADLLKEAATTNRNHATNSSLYFSRHRGLFMTCYKDESAKVFLRSNNDVTRGDCIKEGGFHLNERDTGDGSSDSAFVIRTHLLRFMVVTMCLNIFIAIITLLGAWVMIGKGYGRRLRNISVCTFVNSVLNAAGMLMFQYIHYTEEQVIEYNDQFHAGWGKSSSHMLLIRHTQISYGYSYIIGWLSCVISVVPPILYLVIARTLIIRQRDQNLKVIHRFQNTSQRMHRTRSSSATVDFYYTSSKDKNAAYDYLQKKRKMSAYTT